MAALAAIDSIMITDREPAALNKVSVEKLSRKAYALVKAFENVRCEADWKRPRGDAKNWKSKIDWGAAKKLDPALKDDHLMRMGHVGDGTARRNQKNILKITGAYSVRFSSTKISFASGS